MGNRFDHGCNIGGGSLQRGLIAGAHHKLGGKACVVEFRIGADRCLRVGFLDGPERQADIAFTDPAALYLALDKGEKLVAIYNIYPQNVFNVVALKSSTTAITW